MMKRGSCSQRLLTETVTRFFFKTWVLEEMQHVSYIHMSKIKFQKGAK